MPKNITIRDSLAWAKIAPHTYALDVKVGVLVRYETGYDAVALALVPGATVYSIAPTRQVEVCSDGDPDCGDPDCARKHAGPSAPSLAGRAEQTRDEFMLELHERTPDGTISVDWLIDQLRAAEDRADAIRREERERWAEAMRRDASEFTAMRRETSLWAIASLGWARRLDFNDPGLAPADAPKTDKET